MAEPSQSSQPSSSSASQRMDEGEPPQKKNKVFFKTQTALFVKDKLTTLANGQKKCLLCTKTDKLFQSTTGTSSIARHIERDHNLKWTRSVMAADQPTLSFVKREGGPSKELQPERVVLAFAMNYTVAPNVKRNKYWKAAHEKSYPRGVQMPDGLKKRTREVAKKLDDLTAEVIHGGIGGVQADGGKDVAKNKLIASVVMFDGVPLLHDMFNTDQEELNEDYYYKYYCTP